MRLSSSSLVMASARISCSDSSAKRFTMTSFGRLVGRELYIGILLNKEDPPVDGEQTILQRLRRSLPLNRLFHFYWRFSRGLTLGVRGLVLDREGRVFLIRHAYVDGWHLPGGGVEAGETMAQALERELAEEGNIELTGPPKLHGMFFHPIYSRRDHVALYVVRDFRQSA